MPHPDVHEWQPIDAAIREVAIDNLSGAAEILRRAASIFQILAAKSAHAAPGIPQPDRGLIPEVCARLLKAQPGMAPLENLVRAVRSAESRAADDRQAIELSAAAAQDYSAWAARAACDAATHAAGLISEGSTVLTHSRSSTVASALEMALGAGRRFSVIATESRPAMEGRILAEHLSRSSIPVTIIADAAAAVVMEKVNLVLVGADRIARDCLVNKIGTHMIALAAGELSIPIYAISDTSKFTSRVETNTVLGENRDGGELWPDAPAGVSLLNRYFERIPLKLITGVVTEDGSLTAEKLTARLITSSAPV
jgi:translation initiation factor 2B subunit (eIF-2B alpha/beta/delta family)